MKTIDEGKLREILPLVARPGRYLGNEWNAVRKDLDKVDVKFALAFPDIYDVGMSYLGLRILYGVLNNRDDIACERVFAPWPDFEGWLRKEGMPLFSLESKIPIKDFDIIGFSLTYELNYPNVLNMLDLSGVPLRRVERSDSDPLIIAGGPSAFNPAPMSEFIDAFLIGEGEEAVLEIVDVYKRTKGAQGHKDTRTQDGTVRNLPEGDQSPQPKANSPKPNNETITRKDVLRELANIEGVYVPDFPREVKKRIVKDLDKAFYPVKEIVPYVQIIHDRITLEIMRGCPFSCKFCQASSFYRPARLRSREKILKLALDIYGNTGYDEISLLSLSSSSYPDVFLLVSDLMDAFQGLGVGVSLPSLRSEDMLKLLPSLIAKIRKTGLTFAVEAGSDRLRRHIGKDIDVEKIFRACDEAFRAGWKLVKFYFMIGLPTETYEDLGGIPDFINRILALDKQARLSISITGFVPKAHTFFEGETMENLQGFIDKQNFLKERLKNKRVKLKFHDAKISLLEGKLSRQDNRLSELIFAAWRKGVRLNAWHEFFNFELWTEALNETGFHT